MELKSEIEGRQFNEPKGTKGTCRLEPEPGGFYRHAQFPPSSGASRNGTVQYKNRSALQGRCGLGGVGLVGWAVWMGGLWCDFSGGLGVGLRVGLRVGLGAGRRALGGWFVAWFGGWFLTLVLPVKLLVWGGY